MGNNQRDQRTVGRHWKAASQSRPDDLDNLFSTMEKTVAVARELDTNVRAISKYR